MLSVAGGVASTTVLAAGTSTAAVVDPGGCTATAGLRERLPARRDRDLLDRGFPPDAFSTIVAGRVFATSATSTGSTTAREPWGELVGTMAAAAPALAFSAPAVKGALVGGAAAPRFRRTAFRRGRGVVFSDCSVPGSFTIDVYRHCTTKRRIR